MPSQRCRSLPHTSRPLWRQGWVALACLWHCAVGAQSVAQVQSLDRQQAEQERLRRQMESRPPAYEDKVMDPSSLPAASSSASSDDVPGDGFRAWAIESRAGFTDGSGSSDSSRELGWSAQYQHETLNYGAFLAQIDWNADHRGDTLYVPPLSLRARPSQARVTMRNIGLPLQSGVFVDTVAGDQFSEVTDALGRSYRISLGSVVVRGVGARLYSRDSDVRVGTGAIGALNGSPYLAFQRGRGDMTWAGYSRHFSPEWSMGVQVNRADGTAAPATANTAAAGLLEAVTGLAAGLVFRGAAFGFSDVKGRVVYLRSNTRSDVPGRTGSAQGWSAEGGLTAGGVRHEFGGYATNGALNFGESLAAPDMQGLYWRMDSNEARLNWGLGAQIDQQDAEIASGLRGTRRFGINANAQYRLNRNDSVGGNVNLSFTRYDDDWLSAGSGADGFRSLQANAWYQTRFGDWGPSRLRAGMFRNAALVADGLRATGEEVEWEQDWITARSESLRPEFITSLGMARDRSNERSETRPTAGLRMRIWPDPTWNASANLRYTSRSGNLATSRGVAGTLSLEKQFQDGWRLGATASMNQAVVRPIDASIDAPPVVRSTDRSVGVYVRWEDATGAVPQGAGVREPGTVGAGSLDGTVFFDADRDGRQQLGEAGVPGVEVLLDGRFRTTTDRNGHFNFPLVTTGRHQLTVTPETVPLPWGPAPTPAPTVDVPLRGQATARIPVVRVGE